MSAYDSRWAKYTADAGLEWLTQAGGGAATNTVDGAVSADIRTDISSVDFESYVTWGALPSNGAGLSLGLSKWHEYQSANWLQDGPEYDWKLVPTQIQCW